MKNKMSIWVIQDWAGNFVDFKGRVTIPSFAVPMEFTSFDDAEEYLSEKLGDAYDTDRQEYYIEQV